MNVKVFYHAGDLTGPTLQESADDLRPDPSRYATTQDDKTTDKDADIENQGEDSKKEISWP